jgi:hypothetical protein
MHPLDNRMVGGILHRGRNGAWHGSFEGVHDPEGLERAVEALSQAGVEGLAVIGGNGSLTGGLRLAELGVKVVGIPATIDNDVRCTDMAIGMDTALNTALEAIDRIKDTATSLQRAHVIEVMGRDCGYPALISAIAGGAEAVLVSEFELRPEEVVGAGQTSLHRRGGGGNQALGRIHSRVHKRVRRGVRITPDGARARPAGWVPERIRPGVGEPHGNRRRQGARRGRVRGDDRAAGPPDGTHPAERSGREITSPRPGHVRVGRGADRTTGGDVVPVDPADEESSGRTSSRIELEL